MTEQNQEKKSLQQILKSNTFSRNVAVPGLALLLALTLACALFPDTLSGVLNDVQHWVYTKMSWLYIMLVSTFIIVLAVLAFGKTGNIRLGADNSTPQYSFFSWISMLFAAGMGIGLMYFGVAEPMSHYVNPALPTVANPAKDAQLATFFHWGIHAWGVYAIMGLILAYFSFRYKLPLSVRSGLYPLLKDRINGPIGDAVDIFALVSTFFGTTTSLGFGVVQLNAGLVHLGLLQGSNYGVQCAIIAVVSAVAVGSAVAGVNKGVKRLSEINMWMAVLLLAFVILMGPTIFILSAFSEGIGHYLGNLADLTFGTFAFEKAGRTWFTNWTVMYWAWWISWAPFVGLFIARISKGRTVREYILAVLLVPSLFIFLWMTAFGNGAIWMDQHTLHGALSAIASQTDILLFRFFESFPMATPICALAVVMIAVFFVTSADSSILVMNSIASANRPNSPRWQKAFWGVMLAALAMLLLRTGGLQAMQTMTLITALPFGLVMLLLCFCLIVAMRADIWYHNTKIPYGSVSWDGSQWKEHLGQILSLPQKNDVKMFFSKEVLPAFEKLREQLKRYGIQSEIVRGRRGSLSAELVIPFSQVLNFRYGVAAEKQRVSDVLVEDDNSPIDSGHQYVPVTYYSDGRTGNDIQYLSCDEIIADVLREYERFINVVADEKSAIMVADKGTIVNA
jgi:choline/glycine/proline betaine transport protein